MGKVVDKSHRFLGANELEQRWTVDIKVDVDWRFFKTVVLCFFTGRKLNIEHRLNHNPMQRK